MGINVQTESSGRPKFFPVRDSSYISHHQWLSLNIIFLIAAFVGIISITILSLWISGIFNTFSQLNTLGNFSVYHSEYDLAGQ